MFDWVWSQSSLDFWCWISEFIGGVGMGIFMDTDRDYENDSDLKILED